MNMMNPPQLVPTGSVSGMINYDYVFTLCMEIIAVTEKYCGCKVPQNQGKLPLVFMEMLRKRVYLFIYLLL